MDDALPGLVANKDLEPVVPGAFVINEDIGLPAPEAPPPELRTRLNPEGKAYQGGAEFGPSARGSMRQNTIGGALVEGNAMAAARNLASRNLFETERAALAAGALGDNPELVAIAQRDLERKSAGARDRAEEARALLRQQILYEHSGAFQSGAGVAGTILGAVASPENIGGLSGLLVRQFPMLAGRPIATTAADAALVNTLTDPLVQGVRVGSGAQEKYDPVQTALAPVVGAVAGGALAGAGVAASRAITSLELDAKPTLTPEEIAADMRIASDSFAPDNAQMVMGSTTPAARVADPTEPAAAPDPVASVAAEIEAATGIPAVEIEPILRLADEPAAVGGMANDGEINPTGSNGALDALSGGRQRGSGVESLPAESRGAERAQTPGDGAAESLAAGPEGPAAPALIGAPVANIPPHRVATAAGNAIDVEAIVVDASSLRTSGDVGYDQGLQPRNRDRAASQAQIREIATRLDPERLGFSAEADRGAPIVGPDGMVESGNGRVMAIRRVYEQGGEAAQNYRDWIARQGVDVSGFAEPVIVRQRMTPLDAEQRQAFTVEANQAATLTMSAGERAMADSRLLKTETLDLIRNADDLGAMANREFVQAFIRGLPQSEQGMMATGDGGLSSEGLTRVRNAVLAKAYGDATLLGRIAEATSDEIKSISNALVAAAPDWAKLRSDVAAGLVRADMDLTPDLLEAVGKTADIRAKGTKFNEFLAQQDAFYQLPPRVETWMRMFYNRTGSRAAGAPVIAERLKIFAREARKVSDDDGLAFDLPPVRPEDIQTLAAKKGADDAATGQTQPGLFKRGVSGDGPGDAGGGGRGRGFGPGEGREADGAAGARGDQGGPGYDSAASSQAGRGEIGALSERPLAGDEGLDSDLSRRGAGPANEILPNQMAAGRPKVDQGTDAPAVVKLAGLEDISRRLVEAFPSIARVGRVTGGAQGIFKTRAGVIRVRSVSDFDTLAHEVGHALHLGGGAKSDFDAIIRANIPELEQFGAGQDAVGNAEAFANLFHAYVTSRPFARINYPRATAALDTLLKTKFPEVHKGIEGIRQSLDLLHRAPSVDVIRADTITAPPPRFGDTFRELAGSERDPQGRVVYSAMDALYTGAVDSNHPVYRAMTNLVEIAAANGKTIDLKPMDDAYILARRLPGSHGAADTMLKYGVIAVGDPRPQGPSLSSGIEKALGKKWDAAAFEDFGAYLAARRMVGEYERFFKGQIERPPGKLSLADYVRAVQEFEAARPAFAEGAKDIYAFQQNHMKRQFDKGLVTREYFELASQRADYVPAMRDMRDFPDEPGAPAKTGADGKGLLSRSIMKKFRGSDRPIINPLESIFKRVHDIEFAIARNDSINALARMAEEAGPGSGWIYEDIPSNQLKPQRVDVLEALRAAGKTAGLDSLETKALILQAEDVLGDSTWATLFRQEPIKEGAEPIIYRWVNGERRAGRLGDARLGQELHHALTSLSDYEKDIFTSTLSLTSAILRTGITKAPDFILTNMIRDQFSSALTAGRKYIPFASMAKGLAEALTKSPDAITFAGQGGLAGGAIVEAMSSSQFGRNVKALQSANWFGQVLKAFEVSETGTRVGLFKSYLEQARALGFDEENAALYAVHKADDYIDFRKHGASMGVMRRIFTFLNAYVQGSDRELRAFGDMFVLEAKRAKGGVLTRQELDRLQDGRVALVRLATMGIVLGSGFAVLNQDNEKVQNAPKFFKDTNFLFSLNGMDFAIPKGFGVVQTAVNLFERGTELAMRRDPSLATDWLEAAAGAFMPPTGNPALSLRYDLTANYDRFKGRAIVPYYMQGWDPTEQYTAYTSSLARQVAKAADMAGMKISPMKVDFTLQALGGGMARDVLLSWDAAMGNDRPEKQIYDYPVVRRFVKNLERGSRATEAFYGLVGEKTGEYELAESAYRGKMNNGERAGAAEYLRNLKDDQKAWVTLNTLGFDVAEKRLHPMYGAREQVSIINGLVRQLVNGNVIKEEDVDRRDTVRSRRDATPLVLDPRQRAQLAEELLSLSVATTRNAMVAVGAKGTGGLGLMDAGAITARIRMISPDVATEFDARVARKRLPSFENATRAWPEMKRRLLVDGESADLSDLVPSESKKSRR